MEVSCYGKYYSRHKRIHVLSWDTCENIIHSKMKVNQWLMLTYIGKNTHLHFGFWDYLLLETTFLSVFLYMLKNKLTKFWVKLKKTSVDLFIEVFSLMPGSFAILLLKTLESETVFHIHQLVKFINYKVKENR